MFKAGPAHECAAGEVNIHSIESLTRSLIVSCTRVTAVYTCSEDWWFIHKVLSEHIQWMYKIVQNCTSLSARIFRLANIGGAVVFILI